MHRRAQLRGLDLISGSTVRVLDGPPITSGASASSGAPDAVLATTLFEGGCPILLLLDEDEGNAATLLDNLKERVVEQRLQGDEA